tara:strand:- start:1521 stop:2462 length:942 start_codon:yes stop_codon:yes gene_type:complete
MRGPPLTPEDFGTIGYASLIGAGVSLGLQPLLLKSPSTHSEQAASKIYKGFWESASKKHPVLKDRVPVRIPIGETSKNFYSPSANVVVTGTNVPAGLHEYGHAVNAQKRGKIWRDVWQKAYSTGRYSSITGAVGGGLALIHRTPEGERSTVSKAAPLIAAAPAVPMLAEEGMASGRALNYIRKQKGIKGALKATKSLGPAYASYLAIAAPVPIAIGIISNRMNKREKTKLINAVPHSKTAALLFGALAPLKPPSVGQLAALAQNYSKVPTYTQAAAETLKKLKPVKRNAKANSLPKVRRGANSRTNVQSANVR